MAQLYFTVIVLLLFVGQGCMTEDNVVENSSIRERHRPSYHFTPPAKWMNDPNGMVYYDGEYHLFYQHYPDSTVWGPMHWGHAVSRDLVNWKHLPIALYPDELGYIFSGSAVIDWKNTSGFAEDENPPMVAIFTHHDPVGEKAGRNDFQYQSIAYSNDKGRTWTKYEGNPVISNPGIRDFRDPKVIWNEANETWIMVFAAYDHVKFYGSKNLKDWEYLSDFGREFGTHAGVWECPDLFPIKIEGSQEKKWVLLSSINPGGPNGGSATQYFIGDFNGRSFILDDEFKKRVQKTEAILPNGFVFDDFESGYEKWNLQGDAFGIKPANGSLTSQMNISGFSGKSFVNSYNGGDISLGKMVSEDFQIEKNYINFQVGGGNDKTNLGVRLLIENKEVRSSYGKNNENLRWDGWDVQELKGKTANIAIIDNAKGDWGHINVDHFVFSDQLAIPEKENAVWLDYGRDNYAGVTWSDVPDERRLFMGWMSNWDYAQVVPTKTWRSAMTIARELKLIDTERGLILKTIPVDEMKLLREKKNTFEYTLDTIVEIPYYSQGTEIIVEFDRLYSGNLELIVNNDKGDEYRIGYSGEGNLFYSDRINSGKLDFSDSFGSSIHRAPRQSNNETIRMHFFFDVASVELFADDGTTVITDIFFPQENFTKAYLRCDNGSKNFKISGMSYSLIGN